ncbi:MAG: hypothetical protein QOJ92_1733, partial [Frankiales bacterium]|nr:hypothetical protein [Frankiales bacterium]
MRRAIRLLTGLVLVGSWTVGAASGHAATPEKTLKAPSGIGSASVTYKGTMPLGTQEEGIALGQVGADDPLGFCDPKQPTRNDQHTIKFVVPKVSSKLDETAIFSITWADPNGTAQDFKLVVIGPDGQPVGEADSSSTTETAVVTDVRNGNYTAIACPYNNVKPTAYTGTVKVIVSKPNISAAKGVKAPSYHQYYAPKSINGGAGEPSIGNNWKTGATMFQNGTETYKVAFKGLSSSWTDVSAPNTSVVTLDPILFTDNVTGRTLVSQLVLACSLSAYSDDDGKTWTPSEGCGEVNGVDHQTYGGGPFPKEVAVGALPSSNYKNAVYYCAQGLAFATCALSRDGGLTFGNGNVVYTSECGGLHGHLRVGPDGAAYLPNASCSGNQGVAVSLDAGLTWNVRRVPGTIVGSSDPSVAAGKDGTVYFGVADGSGKPLVAVSRDHGTHWSKPVDVGASFGIHSTEFSEMIAGDGDRAAFAFLGTPTKGYFQGAKFGMNKAGDTYTGGAWHMYVATTYDRGRTWTTVDATPKDPVQRGCIWNGGGSNDCRNLLDFNDITTDKTGRVLIGLADGCSGMRSDCPTDTDKSQNKHEDQGAIVRQTSGRGLFAKYDKVLAKSSHGFVADTASAPTVGALEG